MFNSIIDKEKKRKEQKKKEKQERDCLKSCKYTHSIYKKKKNTNNYSRLTKFF